jgi:Flp pilus assembly protein TadG
MIRRWRGETGQSLIELALVLPMLVVLALGVCEAGYALLDQHIVTKLSREGSNLISRDVTIDAAAKAMRSMATRPVDFDTSSRMIFTVLKRVATTGSTNYDRVIVYQRHAVGALAADSKLAMAGPATFGAAPNYQAPNSDNNPNLRVTNVPADLVLVRGGLMYVTEIYTRHELITPLDGFGITMPDTLYSIAYF